MENGNNLLIDVRSPSSPVVRSRVHALSAVRVSQILVHAGRDLFGAGNENTDSGKGVGVLRRRRIIGQN